MDSSGRTLQIDLSAYLLDEKNQRLFVYIFKDITARKFAESQARGLAVKAKEVEAMGRELTSPHLAYYSAQ